MRLASAIVVIVWAIFGQNYTIQVNTSLNEVVATVRDDAGHLVTGLSAADFRVEQDGVSQTIAHFSPDTETPISLGLLMDIRASITVSGNTVREIGAARVLLRSEAKSGDEVSLMTFRDSVQVREAFTTEPSRIENSLLSLYPRDLVRGKGLKEGNMPLFEAIRRALAEMKHSKYRKRALVLLAESHGEKDLDRFLKEIQSAEVPIFVFGFGGFNTEAVPMAPHQLAAVEVEGRLLAADAIRESVLSRIADETGGKAELMLLLDSSNAVERVIAASEEIAAELRGQYLLGYYAKDSDGAIAHVVHVQAISPLYSVRFRRLPLDKGLPTK